MSQVLRPRASYLDPDEPIVKPVSGLLVDREGVSYIDRNRSRSIWPARQFTLLPRSPGVNETRADGASSHFEF